MKMQLTVQRWLGFQYTGLTWLVSHDDTTLAGGDEMEEMADPIAATPSST